jgi:hypothetical protein
VGETQEQDREPEDMAPVRLPTDDVLGDLPTGSALVEFDAQDCESA